MARTKLKPTYPRSYPMKLIGNQDVLYESHLFLNQKNRVFGNLLRTFLGGLPHDLVENAPHIIVLKEKVSEAETEKIKQQVLQELIQAQQNARIMLTLNWLSVESGFVSSPDIFGHIDGDKTWFVADSEDPNRGDKVVEALQVILERRGLDSESIKCWVEEVSPTLRAEIREDAVWVNRSLAFDSLSLEIEGLNRHETSQIIFEIFGDAESWMTINKIEEEEPKKTIKKKSKTPRVPKKSKKKEPAKDFKIKAGGFLSTNFGTGVKSNLSHQVNILDEIVEVLTSLKEGVLKKEGVSISADTVISQIAQNIEVESTFDDIIAKVKWIGSPSKGRVALDTTFQKRDLILSDIEYLQEKIETEVKGKRGKKTVSFKASFSTQLQVYLENQLGFKFSDFSQTTYTPLLDFACRRVSMNHSQKKNAEETRRENERDKKKLSELPPSVIDYLDAFCIERGQEMGSLNVYWINSKKALGGWNEVVKAWKDCKNEAERIEAVRNIQSESEKKFGDSYLFERFATDKAHVVWENATYLRIYAKAKEAEYNAQSFKVPSFRHPDPFLHPDNLELGDSRWPILYAIHYLKGKGKKFKGLTKEELYNLNPRSVQIELWNGNELEPFIFSIQSKRFWEDIGRLELGVEGPDVPVPRLDRLGCMVTGNPVVSELFNQKTWNGRLTPNREDLERLYKHIFANGWDERSEKLKKKIGWSLVFSAKLTGHGPWIEYQEANKELFAKRVLELEIYKKVQHHWLLNIALSGLPGIRLCAMDYGHRNAASCAVLETLSQSMFEEECRKTNILVPSENVLSITLGKVFYRRIASSNAPAPWAKIEREFILRLQGEDEKPRKLREDEKKLITDLRDFFGCLESGNPYSQENESLRIDEWHKRSISWFRAGLKQHGNLARIGYYLTSDQMPISGGRTKTLPREEMVLKGLLQWFEYLDQEDWKRYQLLKLWNDKIGYPLDSWSDYKTWKKKKVKVETDLKPIAANLMKQPKVLKEIIDTICTKYHKDDTGIQKWLRTLSHWIAPHGLRVLKTDSEEVRKRKLQGQKNARNTGGLSITRITSLQSLREAGKSFASRPDPKDVRKRNAKKGEEQGVFGSRLQTIINNVREQRVKQICSAVTKATLGLVYENNHWVKKYKPCHVIVTENLDNYRPDDLRTRKENKRLMEWSSGKIRDFLSQNCELHGLKFFQVNPSYTSRQDSRTGAPGKRCNDISVDAFLGNFWQKKVNKSKAKKEKERNSWDQYLLLCQEIAEKFKKRSRKERREFWFRIPQNGGSIFMSVDENSPIANGHQADLNSAPNIGFRAVMDPKWEGTHWRVPCSSKDGTPIKTMTANGVFNETDVLLDIEQKGKGDVTNIWRDFEKGSWTPTTHYWNDVGNQIFKRLTADLKKRCQIRNILLDRSV